MRKLLVAGMATALALGGLGIAQAEPGPNGHNEYGLCTAYFNGQKNGWGDPAPPPFEALEEAADDGDDDTSTEQDVYNYCMEVAGGIGGNPDHGRYPDCFDDGDCDN